MNKPQEFKPGDLVVCINKDNTSLLTKGYPYTVTRTTALWVYVNDDNGHEGGWYRKRFIKINL